MKYTKTANGGFCVSSVIVDPSLVDSDNLNVINIEAFALKTGSISKKVYHSPEDNDQEKTKSSVDHQVLTLLLSFITGTTNNEVLEHTPNEHQETDTNDKRNKYSVWEG